MRSDVGLEIELVWLQGLGCQVECDETGFQVRRAGFSSDFNFYHLRDWPQNIEAGPVAEALGEGLPLRLRFCQEQSIALSDWLTRHQLTRETEDDINLCHPGLTSELVADPVMTRLEWLAESRCVGVWLCEGQSIGGFEALIHNGASWLTDVELSLGFRGLGLAAPALRSTVRALGMPCYLQTWETNEPALRAYQASGFLPYERLVRVVRA